MIISRFWSRRLIGKWMFTDLNYWRCGLAYVTSGVSRQAAKSSVTGILFLHHGEPTTVDETLKYCTEQTVAFYALPAFLKEPISKWMSTKRKRNRLSSYLEVPTDLEGIHRKQCESLSTVLQQLLPEIDPYKCYMGYLWTRPSIGDSLDQMKRDGVSRLFVVPQYPHYWCFQSGLCVNELCKQLKMKTSTIDGRPGYLRQWGREIDGESRMIECSLIDRWPVHPALTETYCRLIEDEISTLPYDVQHNVAVLFCAPYPRLYDAAGYRREVSASCLRIMESLRHRLPYKIAWFNSWTQWPIPFIGSLTAGHVGLTRCMANFIHSGHTNIVIVPVTFTAPSIDTEVILRSLCSDEILRKTGVHHARLIRPPNDHPVFIHGLAEIIKNHYMDGSRTSSQFTIRCHRCLWPGCYDSRRIFTTRSHLDTSLT